MNMSSLPPTGIFETPSSIVTTKLIFTASSAALKTAESKVETVKRMIVDSFRSLLIGFWRIPKPIES